MKKSTKIKVFSIIGFVIFFFLLMLFLLSPENIEIIKSVFSDEVSSDEVHDVLLGLGMRGYATVSILAMLQVVLTFLPAEPVQVIAGLAFGFPVGLLLCTIGVVVGNTIIYILYHVFGDKLNQYFDRKLHFDFEKLGKSGRITLTIFILYFLPAIPYGMICFFAATMRMKYPRFIIVTTLGAIPSVGIGVGLGHLAVSTSWILSVSIFVVLVAVLAVLMKKKDVLFEKLDKIMTKEKEPYSSKTTVRAYSRIKLDIAYVISRVIFFFKGIRVKYTSRVGKVGKIEAPA
ncbi:MAG: VTT domain-containing protein, partial [Clostridia bacterium]|nr:VTT domain-containing protein [Clostridia bacterium]